MQRIQLGTKVQSLGINRVNVAAGMKCRCVLIDPNPQFKYIAYDDDLKRKVEVDQDLLLKYNLRASPTFYYLVAKLNTDMKGQVVSDEFVVEYLQLSENLNNEFSDAVAENPNFASLVLTKVEKKGDGGKDFSYIKTTPSNYAVDESIMQKIETMRSNKEALDAMWALIDRSTSISPAEYIKLKEEAPAPTTLPAARTQASKQIAAPAMPTAPDDFAEKNEFASGDDFDF